MSNDTPRTVVIDGHNVPEGIVDRFYNHDGTRVSDEQWDESARRIAEAENADGDNVTWQIIDENGEAV